MVVGLVGDLDLPFVLVDFDLVGLVVVGTNLVLVLEGVLLLVVVVVVAGSAGAGVVVGG